MNATLRTLSSGLGAALLAAFVMACTPAPDGSDSGAPDSGAGGTEVRGGDMRGGTDTAAPQKDGADEPDLEDTAAPDTAAPGFNDFEAMAFAPVGTCGALNEGDLYRSRTGFDPITTTICGGGDTCWIRNADFDQFDADGPGGNPAKASYDELYCKCSGSDACKATAPTEFVYDPDGPGASGTTSTQWTSGGGFDLNDCEDRINGAGAGTADDGANFHPFATETWYDGLDYNCDFKNDYDQDMDTYVATAHNSQFGGTAPNQNDCNDLPGVATGPVATSLTGAQINPGVSGANDDAYDGIDENCGNAGNGQPEFDADGDGQYCTTNVHANCDDAATFYSHTAQDCLEAGALGPVTKQRAATAPWLDGAGCHTDADGDNYGRAAVALPANAASGVTPGTDCDDTPTTGVNTFPGAAQTESSTSCRNDDDNDGYGDDTVTSPVVAGGDCNDASSAIKPGFDEGATPSLVGNNVDEDCDTNISCFTDLDIDGYGSTTVKELPKTTSGACHQPNATHQAADDDDDCDDTVLTGSQTFPGAAQNETPSTSCRRDNDNDGYGARNQSSPIDSGGDCDDTVATGSGAYPGLAEIVGDTIDQNCNDLLSCYTDADRDGYGTSTVKEIAVAATSCDQPNATYTAADDQGDCKGDASSCTTDCTTDVDTDNVPDCFDRCDDVDEDNYGVTRTSEVLGTGAVAVGSCTSNGSTACAWTDGTCTAADCKESASSCTTDCSDGDTDGVFDCFDRCNDTDEDNYGVTRNTDVIGTGAAAVQDCKVAGPGTAACAWGDATCTATDCLESASSCTTDCSDTLDGDTVPDCFDRCDDDDRDNYGSTRSTQIIGTNAVAVQDCKSDGTLTCVWGDGTCADADCRENASSCTTDCATDADVDGVSDCWDRCSDPDEDNYGVTRTSEVLGTGAVAVGSCTTNGSTACSFGDGTCADVDCKENANSCTNDCSDTVDSDGVPDCFDRCNDPDEDDYGVTRTTQVVGTGAAQVQNCKTDGTTGPGGGTPCSWDDAVCTATDCRENANSCTTDCTTDADTDGVSDCFDRCTDVDEDNYGITRTTQVLGVGAVAVEDCKTNGIGGTTCSWTDGVCTATDCLDSASSCTTDCATDADDDEIADCVDRCNDPDEDNYGVTRSSEVLGDNAATVLACKSDGQATCVWADAACVTTDCKENASSCTNDCLTDADSDLVADCFDRCSDVDEDNYGTTRTTQILGTGAVAVQDCKADGQAPCVWDDAVCTSTDCMDTASSCTDDCTTNVDGDATPDCFDRCSDVDEDNYGTTRTTEILGTNAVAVSDCKSNGQATCVWGDAACTNTDCDDAASSCTTTCTGDADSDGVKDCFDGCGDVDEDNYGTNRTSTVVGTGAAAIGSCKSDGQANCVLGDAVCTLSDCDDAASSCTDSCATDADVDGVKDCIDLCGDTDEDNYGTNRSTAVTGTNAFQVAQCTTDGSTPCTFPDLACVATDCLDSASSCTTDCASDLDSDGAMDCRDLCSDLDSDNFGQNRSGIQVGDGAATVGSCKTDGQTNCTPLDPACSSVDCDDTSATASVTFPGSAENDSTTDCMRDVDGDGWGDDVVPAGVTAGRDCSDSGNESTLRGTTINSNLIHPTTASLAGNRASGETWYDGVDQNCDGWSDLDQDGDGQSCRFGANPLDTCPTFGNGGLDCMDSPAGLAKEPGLTVFVPGDQIKYDPDRTDEAAWYDGIDQNCDGWNDYDQDGDGYQCSPTLVAGCAHKPGGNDCYDSLTNKAPTVITDPALPSVPGAEINIAGVETYYDGIDENCDGLNDFDQDLDDYIATHHPDDPDVTFAFDRTSTDAPNVGDCEDNPVGRMTATVPSVPIAGNAIKPLAADPAYDGVDQNCDNFSDYDWDADGFNTCSFPLLYPNDDDDSDGALDDCDCVDAPSGATTVGGQTVAGSSIKPTSGPTSQTRRAEVPYNGIDDNCDSSSDFDQDGDGYDCDPASAYNLCPGAPANGEDCNDNPGLAGQDFAPNKLEVCDGTPVTSQVDNDCDGSVNTQGGVYFDDSTYAQLGPAAREYFYDADQDSYGDADSTGTWLCARSLEPLPSYYVPDNSDCVDSDETINPAAPELCDNKDNNCNELRDEPTPLVAPPPLCTAYYIDGDEDGVGTDAPDGTPDTQICVCGGFATDDANTIPRCNPQEGQDSNVLFEDKCWSPEPTDCRDAAANIFPPAPSATKIEKVDGFDNDCDGKLAVIELDCDNDNSYAQLPISPDAGFDPVEDGFAHATDIGLADCNDFPNAPTITCLDQNLTTQCDDRTGLWTVDVSVLEEAEVFDNGGRVGQLSVGCDEAMWDCDDNCISRCGGLDEMCDGIDNDCEQAARLNDLVDDNGLPDSMESGIPNFGYVVEEELDLDGDGQITCTSDPLGSQVWVTSRSCNAYSGDAALGDCNDQCSSIKTADGAEICNGFTNADNCDSTAGEGPDGDGDRYRVCGAWGAVDAPTVDEDVFAVLYVAGNLEPIDEDTPLDTKVVPLVPPRGAHAAECDAALVDAQELIGVVETEQDEWWELALEQCIAADVCAETGGAPPSGWPADCTRYENTRCATTVLAITPDADDEIYDQNIEGCMDDTERHPEQMITRTVWSHERILGARRLVVEWECYRMFGTWGCGDTADNADPAFVSPYADQVPGQGGFVGLPLSASALIDILDADPRWWKEVERYSPEPLGLGSVMGCWGDPGRGVDELNAFDYTGGDCDAGESSANRDMPEGPDDLVGIYNDAPADCSTCLDGIDNNCDGYVDCADPACARCFVGQGLGCGGSECVQSGCNYGSGPGGVPTPAGFGTLLGLALAAAGMRRRETR